LSPDRAEIHDAQENPELPHGGADGGPDDRAPLLLPSLKLPDEIIFFISALLHLLHVTVDISEDERICSKLSPHLLQLNS